MLPTPRMRRQVQRRREIKITESHLEEFQRLMAPQIDCRAHFKSQKVHSTPYWRDNNLHFPQNKPHWCFASRTWSQNYFAKRLWPKAQFFEVKFKGKIRDPDHNSAFRRFLTNLSKEKIPGLKFPLTFATFMPSHLGDTRGCIITSTYDGRNLHKASNLNRFEPAKQAKYSKLLFTVYGKPMLQLANVTVHVDHDIIRGDYNFTDGCGSISPDLMAELVLGYKGQTDSEICAIQCRLPGIKGMLVVDVRAPARTIRLRESMVKLKVLEVLEHKANFDGSRTYSLLPVVVLKCNQVSDCAFLNTQIISLFMSLGVPFAKFHTRIRTYVESIMYMGLDCRYALQFFHLRGLDEAQLRSKLQAKRLQLASVHDEILDRQANAQASLRKKANKERLRIPITKARLLLGVCDYTNSIYNGECFLQITTPDNPKPQAIVGKVAVTRNPCYHPGDVRILYAIGACPALQHLTNVIVFSTQGHRPAPDEMAGGDLDGDSFFVIWDQELLPPAAISATAFDYRPSAVRQHIRRWATRVSAPILPTTRQNPLRGMARVTDYILRGGSTQTISLVDNLMQQLQGLPPSSERRELNEVLNALFVCGVDQLDINIDMVLSAINMRIRHAVKAAGIDGTPDEINKLAALVHPCLDMRKTPTALSASVFASSVDKIETPVSPEDFLDLQKLFMWAVLDVLTNLEKKVLRDASIPDSLAITFEPTVVKRVVQEVDMLQKEIRKQHDAFCNRKEAQIFSKIKLLQNGLDEINLKTANVARLVQTAKEEVDVLKASLDKEELHAAKLLEAYKAPARYFFMSYLLTEADRQADAKNKQRQHDEYIDQCAKVKELKQTFQSKRLELLNLQMQANIETMAALLAVQRLNAQKFLVTPDIADAFMQGTKSLETLIERRDQFVSLCTAFASAGAGLPMDEARVALLNECLIAEINMFTKDLPVYKQRNELVETLEKHSMTLITSETGSGKSTCVPQFYLTHRILDESTSAAQRFCLVLPRRAATKNLARHLAETRGTDVGQTIGYHVGTNAGRSDRQVHASRTLLECVSGGVILGKSISDPWFAQFSVIFVDEVHEESPDLYLLLGKLKAARKHHSKLKIVLMSAKVDELRLISFYGSMAVEKLPGRQFPVTSEYCGSDSGDYVAQALRQGDDVLVFMPRISDIEDAIGRIYIIEDMPMNSVKAWPLHSRVDNKIKDSVLSGKDCGKIRNVIFATNIAEASLTIPNLGYVVDTGLEVVVTRDVMSGAIVHKINSIAQTSVIQRKGRAGRLGPGKCFHLYSEADHLNFAQTKTANYNDLEFNTLRLIASETNPFSFDWIQHPGTRELNFCVDLLRKFKMIEMGTDNEWHITSKGLDASKLLRLGIDINCVELLLFSRENETLLTKAAIVIGCMEYAHLFRRCEFKTGLDIDWDATSVCDNFVNLFYEYQRQTKKKEWAVLLSLPLHAFESIDRLRKKILHEVQLLDPIGECENGTVKTWNECVAAAYPNGHLRILRFNNIGPELYFVDNPSTTIRILKDEMARQRLEWSMEKTYVAMLISCHRNNPSWLFGSFVEEIYDTNSGGPPENPYESLYYTSTRLY
ncbi:hypothetical protein Ae201684_001687 [Aphanomyces euteiches]|uniref:Uncharacterized protein n=1 Tax=Aphanomyces euteiches TaxID=100861 RepID=A0A6G0XTW3_9STRA|nr:hypothetical protein Ae201684_001687 [Aphanomyces euteiches]KAH9154440.1 hypothetical protein AeRB84_003478 [Aphanomyces euteiches]